MVCACIDIGSNTTRLLVAEAGPAGLREVLQERAFTKLGSRGQITPGKIAEVAEAVARQVRVARECGAHRIRAVATHAVRHAGNGEELCAAVRRAAGIPVEILTGDEEAAYAFRGATLTLGDPPPGRVGVVDVGGGSTELVCGTADGGVSWSVSVHVGSCSLTDDHIRSDPPTTEELARVRAHAREVLAGLDVPRPAVAYAVGGSATSLHRLLGPQLDGTALRRGVEVLVAEPVAAAARRLELHPDRVRLLPAGILLLEAAADVFGAPLRIARGGLREGVLLESLELEGVAG